MEYKYYELGVEMKSHSDVPNPYYTTLFRCDATLSKKEVEKLYESKNKGELVMRINEVSEKYYDNYWNF